MAELAEVTRRLDGIDGRLQDISRTLEAVAIQGERLTNIQSQVSELWRKIDTIQRTQDKCPIQFISKTFWIVQGAIIVAIIGVGLKTFGVV